MSSTARSSVWSVTINNPTERDEEEINLARQKGWKVEGQKEKGSEGTEHYQLMVTTPQCRFSALKKAFTRAHIEIGVNKNALKNYVHKEETRVGDLQQQDDKYPSLQKFWTLLYIVYDVKDETSIQCKEAIKDKRYDHFRLYAFDCAVKRLIDGDYIVEPLATNPSVRSSFKIFGNEILNRCKRTLERQDRQTDSTPDLVLQTYENIPAECLDEMEEAPVEYVEELYNHTLENGLPWDY